VRGQWLISVCGSLAIWNGEWGPVYSDDDSVNVARLHVLKDQLELYEEAQIGWSIWL